MSTLADEFLKDLNDGDDIDDNINNTKYDVDDDERRDTESTSTISTTDQHMKDGDEEDKGDNEDLQLSDEMLEKKQIELISNLKDAPLESIATLRSSNRLANLLTKVKNQLEQDLPEKGTKTAKAVIEHQLIVDCNKTVQDIQHEVYLIHKYVKEKYSVKLPSLHTTIPNPLDYISVVKRIGNQEDLVNINFNDLLPKSTVMVVIMSSGTGKKLSDDEIKRVLDACDMALELDEHKKTILGYLESRMTFIAPNLSTLLGGSIAARLIGIAGSVQQLSIIPAGNLQTFGASTKSLQGFSGITNRKFQMGLISQCDLVKQAPAYLQKQAIRVLTGRVSIVARVDSLQESNLYGELGNQYKEEISAKIVKWQEPPPTKQVKALAAPDETTKNTRGGRKARAMKERYGMTEMRKAQNRMVFGEEEKTIGDSDVGLGMVGGNSGRLRILAQDRGILKKKKMMDKSMGTSSVAGGGQSTTKGGLQSMTKGAQSTIRGVGGTITMSGLQSVMVTPGAGIQLGSATSVSLNNGNSGTTTAINGGKYFGGEGIKRKIDQVNL